MSFMEISRGNILILPNGSTCLADFGLSSIIDQEELKWNSIKTISKIGGTIRWEAPELLVWNPESENPKLAFKINVYSMVSMIYATLTSPTVSDCEYDDQDYHGEYHDPNHESHTLEEWWTNEDPYFDEVPEHSDIHEEYAPDGMDKWSVVDENNSYFGIDTLSLTSEEDLLVLLSDATDASVPSRSTASNALDDSVQDMQRLSEVILTSEERLDQRVRLKGAKAQQVMDNLQKVHYDQSTSDSLRYKTCDASSRLGGLSMTFPSSVHSLKEIPSPKALAGLTYLHEKRISHGNINLYSEFVKWFRMPHRLPIIFFCRRRNVTLELTATLYQGHEDDREVAGLENELKTPRPNLQSDIYAMALVGVYILMAIIKQVMPAEPSDAEMEGLELTDELWQLFLECWSQVPDE
ncbi:hypothetical protein AN958_12422 [Leucoagaricus sp. SymC.cos]|nr:hypothetical protein AN958_12422 [Leucoagaricus sp. SymC.cos]